MDGPILWGGPRFGPCPKGIRVGSSLWSGTIGPSKPSPSPPAQGKFAWNRLKSAHSKGLWRAYWAGQSLLVEQNSRPLKVKILALFLRNSQATSKDGSRVKEKEGEIRDISADVHRYVEILTKQSPSPLFSIFGQPLISRGSWGVL